MAEAARSAVAVAAAEAADAASGTHPASCCCSHPARLVVAASEQRSNSRSGSRRGRICFSPHHHRHFGVFQPRWEICCRSIACAMRTHESNIHVHGG
jgi:hypothetical protein